MTPQKRLSYFPKQEGLREPFPDWRTMRILKISGNRRISRPRSYHRDKSLARRLKGRRAGGGRGIYASETAGMRRLCGALRRQVLIRRLRIITTSDLGGGEGPGRGTRYVAG